MYLMILNAFGLLRVCAAAFIEAQQIPKSSSVHQFLRYMKRHDFSPLFMDIPHKSIAEFRLCDKKECNRENCGNLFKKISEFAGLKNSIKYGKI